MFICTTKYINGIAFEFFFEVQALEEGVGFIFAGSKGEHIVDCDDEEGNHESTPKAHDETNKTTKVSLWIDISVTCRRQGYYYIPHRV